MGGQKETGVGTPPPVHPHVRGDYADLCSNSLPTPGSPPRAWGLLDEGGYVGVLERFTPHVRGDYEVIASRKRPSNGSPPHAWGLPEDALLINRARRFTPTCVGTTFGLSAQRCA